MTDPFRIVLDQARRGLTGGFLLLWIFSVAISVSPHFCFILDLILISMFVFFKTTHFLCGCIVVLRPR